MGVYTVLYTVLCLCSEQVQGGRPPPGSPRVISEVRICCDFRLLQCDPFGGQVHRHLQTALRSCGRPACNLDGPDLRLESQHAIALQVAKGPEEVGQRFVCPSEPAQDLCLDALTNAHHLQDRMPAARV
jgi:hypothetical protein